MEVRNPEFHVYVPELPQPPVAGEKVADELTRLCPTNDCNEIFRFFGEYSIYKEKLEIIIKETEKLKKSTERINNVK